MGFGLRPSALSSFPVASAAAVSGLMKQFFADDTATHPNGQPNEGEEYIPYRADAASLLRFLKDDVVPTIETTHSQAVRRPAIRLQAHGESLDPFRADRILALDERLTRQFGKTLTMLIRLRETRPAGPTTA